MKIIIPISKYVVVVISHLLDASAGCRCAYRCSMGPLPCGGRKTWMLRSKGLYTI